MVEKKMDKKVAEKKPAMEPKTVKVEKKEVESPVLATEMITVDGKKEIYLGIQKKVEEAGAKVSLAVAKEIYDFAMTKTFDIVKKEGYFRFPAGLGSLVKKTIGKPGSKKPLPSGRVVEVGVRDVIRYKAGTKAMASV